MEFRKLGPSDLAVSAVGLGTLAFGGAYGPVDEGELVRSVHRALEVGVNFFDTSDNYGEGRAEEILGRALRGRRGQALVATKGGTARDERGRITNDARPEALLRAAEASLRRLGTDWIDLYQLHLPDPATPPEETALALERLVRDGKVRYVGLSNFWEEDLRLWDRAFPAVANQLPYNPLHRDLEAQVLPLCRAMGMGIIAYQPLLFGLFGGRLDPEAFLHPDDHRATYPGFRELVQATETLRTELSHLARDWGLTLPQLVLRWVISRPGVACALVGARRPHQVAENAVAGDHALRPEELETVDALLMRHPLDIPRTLPLPVERVETGPQGPYALLALGIKVRVPPGVKVGDRLTMDIVTGQVRPEG